MKKISLFVFVLLGLGHYHCQAQTPVVYLNFLSHNEETNSWDNINYYTANRSKLIAIANYFDSAGITWNMQSDWRYLNNSIANEVTPLTANTNNKHVLRWMNEDKGVEMDPHAHESLYLYPDVAKLMDSIGLPLSKIMGGSIYNDSNGVNIWTNLINGQYGAIYPNYFWKPSYMMGGGTPNHVNDLNYFGFWNPQSPATYTTHDTSTPLVHFATGCPFKIRDTSNIPQMVSEIRDIISKIKGGLYPSSGIYYQSIFFGQGDLGNQALYDKIFEVADSLNAIVASGDAEWKTMKQTYTYWENTYQHQMFQWECGQIVNAISNASKTTQMLSAYPNPTADQLILNHIDTKYPLCLSDITGQPIQKYFPDQHHLLLTVTALPKGVYLLRNGLSVLKWVKE